MTGERYSPDSLASGNLARGRIVATARAAVTDPPYGRNLASNAYVTGLLTAADLVGRDAPRLEVPHPTINPLSITANLARRGLLPSQLRPYDDPERGWVDPRAERDTIDSAFDFIGWIAQEVTDG